MQYLVNILKTKRSYCCNTSQRVDSCDGRLAAKKTQTLRSFLISTKKKKKTLGIYRGKPSNLILIRYGYRL